MKNLEAGKTVEGGSTITQQLVRNLCLRNPKRDLERKIIEAKLAIEYAEQHSRREILDQYLNTATYGTVEGSTTVGVGAAAQIYFSKPVSKLSLEQSALLAGLPQAPSEYNPILHPGRSPAAAQLGAGQDGPPRLPLPRARPPGRSNAASGSTSPAPTSPTANPSSSTTSNTS